MASAYYSYLAFIEPGSDANLEILKTNLDEFYAKPTITNKPDITLNSRSITLTFNDGYAFYINLSNEQHVNGEAKEFADTNDLDWYEKPVDKEKLLSCTSRLEIYGEDDYNMNYFNDSLYIVETIGAFKGVIVFFLN
ncbi:MAG: hypothetical protein ABIP51_18815 [Bacteroidia bacterium]